MRRALFYDNEYFASADRLIDSVAVVDNIHEGCAAMHAISDGLIHRGAITANTPAGGITIASLVSLQGGKMIYINTPQTVNILANNGTWGTGQAAHATNNRYTVVAIKYVTKDSTPGDRNFFNPETGEPFASPSTVNTTREAHYRIEVIHGLGNPSEPTIPVVPADYIKVCTIYIPAGATAVVPQFIAYDIDTSNMTLGDTTKLMRVQDYVGNSFVRTGLICSINSVNTSILDTTVGTAIIRQADGSFKFVDKPARGFIAHQAGTYFLDLKPDGLYAWGTAHPPAGYLAICSATVNASLAITNVTDLRVLTNGINAGSLSDHNATSLATEDTLILRDASGRAKVAVPAEVDDIIRKADVDAHAALINAHSAASAATPNVIMMRDESGRAKVAAPSAADDIATKGIVDTHASLTNAHSATSAATASRIILRDSFGRAKVATPSVASDIARKDTIDTHASSNTTHGGPIMNVGGITNPENGVDIVGGTGITINKDTQNKLIEIIAQSNDAVTPHNSTHFTNGADPVTADNIGAASTTGTQTAITTHNNVLNAHSAASAASANAIMARDASGRAKVAAPSASDDIATKGTVDTVQSAFSAHHGQNGVDQHPVVGATNGFMHPDYKTKLGGIATGATADHTKLSNKGTNTHAQIDTHIAATAPHTGHISHSLATAQNDFLAASVAGTFVKKTLAQTKSILGLGTAADNADTDFALIAHVGANGNIHGLADISNAGFMSSEQVSKLTGIETGATQDLTNLEIRDALLTVDGSGSGFNADKVDGLHASDLQLKTQVTGYVTYDEQVSGTGDIPKSIPLGSSEYRHGRAVLKNSVTAGRGITVYFGTDSTKTLVVGFQGNFAFGAWSRRSIGTVTQTLGNGQGICGSSANITVKEVYINGSDLIVIFRNNTSTTKSIQCTVDWTVW